MSAVTHKRKETERPQPRKGVAEVPFYIPGEAVAEGVAHPVKLSSNESAGGVSPSALAVLHTLPSLAHLYPDAHAVELKSALARKHGLSADQIVCGCGSEELLHLIARAYVDAGDEAIVSQYGFVSHHIAPLANGGRLIKVPEKAFRVDLDAMLLAVTPKTKLVYVANPGNPTGTMLPFSAIRDFHAALPGSVVLVVDAAYAEFAEENEGYSAGIELVREGADNVMVTRTFSKMYGLAALRIGWAYCSPDIAGCLNRVRPAFNANAFAQQAATAALEDDAFVETNRRANQAGLETLTAGLERLNVDVTPSVCNFVLAHFERFGAGAAASVFEGMRRRGVIVRPVGGYGLPNSLRISVGTAADNQACLGALEAALAGL